MLSVAEMFCDVLLRPDKDAVGKLPGLETVVEEADVETFVGLGVFVDDGEGIVPYAM